MDQINGRLAGQVLVSISASREEQLAQLKGEVMANIAADGLLYEASGEEWRIDTEGPWSISTMVTAREGALLVATSRLGQSMSAAMDRIAGHLTYDMPHAQHLLPEAMQVHADRLCVPRQVATI